MDPNRIPTRNQNYRSASSGRTTGRTTGKKTTSSTRIDGVNPRRVEDRSDLVRRQIWIVDEGSVRCVEIEDESSSRRERIDDVSPRCDGICRDASRRRTVGVQDECARKSIRIEYKIIGRRDIKGRKARGRRKKGSERERHGERGC